MGNASKKKSLNIMHMVKMRRKSQFLEQRSNLSSRSISNPLANSPNVSPKKKLSRLSKGSVMLDDKLPSPLLKPDDSHDQRELDTIRDENESVSNCSHVSRKNSRKARLSKIFKLNKTFDVNEEPSEDLRLPELPSSTKNSSQKKIKVNFVLNFLLLYPQFV